MAAGKNNGDWKMWGVPIGFVDSLSGRFSRLSCFLCQNDKKRHSKPFKEIELCDLSMGFIPISVLLYEFVFGWWVTHLSTRDFFCIDHGPTSGDPLGFGGWTFGPGTGAELVRAFSADQG